jgi:uncharacterized OsmC-like protein
MTAPTAPSVPTAANVRTYDVAARSTDIFGRVLCSARDHHFIVDGPVQNDCPGEEITPAESFLSGVAACGVELMHVIARDQQVPLQRASVEIHGIVDRDHPPRPDLTLFNVVRLNVTLWGVTLAQATAVVDGFKKRCPLYGTVAAATPDVKVSVAVGT